MEQNTHGIPVIEFYTWSKTNGHTSSRMYITINNPESWIVGGQIVGEGFADPIPMNVLARVKVTNAKMKELESLSKKGY